MPRDNADAYLKTKVLTAPPEQLRLMLLDGAIRFTTQGRDALLRKDFEGIYEGFSQAREIVLELATSVKDQPNPDLAAQVRSLYLFIFQQIVNASFQKDVSLANDALRLLEYERETWQLAIDQAAQDRAQQTATHHAGSTHPAPTGELGETGPIGSIGPASAPANEHGSLQRGSISFQA